MYDVIALGELLVDFTNNGTSDQGNMLFEANPANSGLLRPVLRSKTAVMRS